MGNYVKSDASRLTTVALTLAMVAAACGGDVSTVTSLAPVPVLVPTTTTSVPPTTVATTSPAVSSAPVMVDSLCDLVSFEETEQALGEFVSGELAQDAFPNSIDLTQPGEYYCQHETDSGTYVQIAQGSPADLESGAEM